MLVASFHVRRLVPADPEAYAASFQEGAAPYAGGWQTDPDGDIGEAVSEHMVPTQNASGQMTFQPLLGVLWGEKKIPAIEYCDPTYLENVDEEVQAAGESGEDEGEGE